MSLPTLARSEKDLFIHADRIAQIVEFLNTLVVPVVTVPSASTRTVTAATDTIQATDTIVYVNRAGAVTITLSDAAAWLAAAGHTTEVQLIIQDVSGASSTNTITINRAGSDTVNGLTSVTITTDYGGYKLRPAASGLWVIQ